MLVIFDALCCQCVNNNNQNRTKEEEEEDEEERISFDSLFLLEIKANKTKKISSLK